MRSAVRAAVFLSVLACGGGARAQTTDLLLVLAADVSRSIDETEFALQRKGYSAALTDPLRARRRSAVGQLLARSRSCFVEGRRLGSPEYRRRLVR